MIIEVVLVEFLRVELIIYVLTKSYKNNIYCNKRSFLYNSNIRNPRKEG